MNNSNPKIELIDDYDYNQYNKIIELLYQLYPDNKPITRDDYKCIIKNDYIYILIALVNNQIIGTASLVIYKKLGGVVGVIEDVIVDKNSRGLGIGSKLTKGLLSLAKNKCLDFLDVNTRRQSAKEFYIKHGFQEKSNSKPFYSLRYYY